MCQGTWSPIRGNGLCPRKYGTTVDLSGRFPSERLRDNGSNGAGISADAKAVFIDWLLQYDTTWYIYVRSKANEMASLVQRTAQKQKYRKNKNNKNSSGDEIANVNFLRRYGTTYFKILKKENLLRLTN